ncbi:MAG TPA: polysaccharide deacetylase family protein [Fimbriimonadaceae bacterium]|nr:polysaccharide deacetylase family protein [Fimbriimonadaceae bacterium]
MLNHQPAITLTFHGVGPTSRSLAPGERDCWLDRDVFESVLDLVCSFPNAKLTFDDGNASDIAVALPLLQERKLTAAFFICSERLHIPGFLDCDGVKHLNECGMSVGSHGVRHVPWRGLDAAALDHELQRSRQTFEEILRLPVEAAACPFGAYDRSVLKGLRRAEYRTVYTSDGGISYPSQWVQARTTVRRTSRLPELRHLLLAGPSAVAVLAARLRSFLKRLR